MKKWPKSIRFGIFWIWENKISDFGCMISDLRDFEIQCSIFIIKKLNLSYPVSPEAGSDTQKNHGEIRGFLLFEALLNSNF